MDCWLKVCLLVLFSLCDFMMLGCLMKFFAESIFSFPQKRRAYDEGYLDGFRHKRNGGKLEDFDMKQICKQRCFKKYADGLKDGYELAKNFMISS